MASLACRLIAYARYLNQTGLDHSYTDSFGRTTQLHLRQDVQWNKVNLSFKGWLFDPNFTYRVWIWTQQPAMGEGAQVVVGGQLGYHFNDYFNVYAGIAPLPSTRSTNWTYPFWLKMDNRTIADDFFRASYSQGIWADGKILDDLAVSGHDRQQPFRPWRVRIAARCAVQHDVGRRLVDADDRRVRSRRRASATSKVTRTSPRFLACTTRAAAKTSRISPASNDIENSQIRLSDGTLLFSPNAFNTGGQINQATYQMVDLDMAGQISRLLARRRILLALGERLQNHRLHSRQQVSSIRAFRCRHRR